MAIYVWCLLLASSLLATIDGVVIPRPPSGIQGYEAAPHKRQLFVVTSSELPKQIPAPSQPPHQSSTPQYLEEEEQIPGTAQLRLVWVTQEMGTSAPVQTTKLQKSFEQRTDLMPNMV